jgi:CRP-like cAMP-binding protein
VGQTVRTATATTLEDCRILRIDKAVMLRLLQGKPTFASAFMSYLLTHSIRVQEDLVDQLFNSSEKRLARGLLLLAGSGTRFHQRQAGGLDRGGWVARAMHRKRERLSGEKKA